MIPATLINPTISDQIDELVIEVMSLLEGRKEWLSRLTVGVPVDTPIADVEEALVERLATCGVDFVDLDFEEGHPCLCLLHARFDPGWAK